MFTNKKAKYYGDNKVLLDSACLSTDTKPTTGVANGSKCIEMDTGKTYMFNEEDSEWEELPSSGGGGGGSSDFSTATVTVASTLEVPVIINCAAEIEDEGTGGLAFISPGMSSNVTIILFKGKGRITTGAGATITSSEGNITVDEGGGAGTVTGDCTITIGSGNSGDIS